MYSIISSLKCKVRKSLKRRKFSSSSEQSDTPRLDLSPVHALIQFVISYVGGIQRLTIVSRAHASVNLDGGIRCYLYCSGINALRSADISTRLHTSSISRRVRWFTYRWRVIVTPHTSSSTCCKGRSGQWNGSCTVAPGSSSSSMGSALPSAWPRESIQ